jgi:hypothetical protein
MQNNIKGCNTCLKAAHDRFLGDVYGCEYFERMTFLEPMNRIVGITYDCPKWVQDNRDWTDIDKHIKEWNEKHEAQKGCFK